MTSHAQQFFPFDDAMYLFDLAQRKFERRFGIVLLEPQFRRRARDQFLKISGRGFALALGMALDDDTVAGMEPGSRHRLIDVPCT